MKIKVDWKTLGVQIWAALKPVLLAAIGGGIVSYTSGCTSMETTPRGQTTEIVAVGVPAIAWISHSTETAAQTGGDTVTPTQAPVVSTTNAATATLEK